MAIQMRRGAYSAFDKTKLLAAEFAVVMSGDPSTSDGAALYICMSTGNVKRVACWEDMAQIIAQVIGDSLDVSIESGDSALQVTRSEEDEESVYTIAHRSPFVNGHTGLDPAALAAGNRTVLGTTQLTYGDSFWIPCITTDPHGHAATISYRRLVLPNTFALATADRAGAVWPDGTTITLQEDGTISVPLATDTADGLLSSEWYAALYDIASNGPVVVDAYEVGETEYADDWLSDESEGDPIEPLDGRLYVIVDGDHQNEVFRWDGTAYAPVSAVINVATTQVAGKVKPDGVTITIDEDGTIHGANTYVLPTMSTTTKGGATVGDGLTMDEDALEVDTQVIATQLDLGDVRDALGELASDVSDMAEDMPVASSTSPAMDGTAAAGSSTDYARADHVHPTDTSRMAAALKGAANGVAELDANGLVPTAQLPSYVDDVLEYAGTSSFPVTGETGKIYVDTTDNSTYRWAGSAYVEISNPLDYATQAEAEAGVENTHVMTALRTKQAIDANAYTLPTMSASTKGGAKVGDGLAMTGDVLSTTNDMGLSGTSVGQVPVVGTVDENGVPTSWAAASMAQKVLTVTVTTHDAQTVTGITVTVRVADATGEVVATAPYAGTPLTFTLPFGMQYHVSASDDLRMYGPPSVATGVVGESAAMATLTYAALNSVLEKDTNTGRYTNASLSDWWSRQKDGKVYGVSIPKSTALLSTKTRDNANIADPVPSTLAVTGSDPYATGKCGPYLHYDVNGGTDTDGTPYVTAIRGIDNDFALDGTNGNVWSMCPVLFEKWTNDTSSIEWAVSDTEFDGSTLQPGAKLPASGTRPYMLYAKYGGGMYNGAYASVSGVDVRTRDVSYNTLITVTSSASTGYSGKSVADDWYQKMLWYTKYSNKDKQNYMQGCTNYNLQYYVTVAETNTRRVIISKTNAANLLVGSTVCLGTMAGGNSDRNRADMHDVVDLAHITAIEDYDSSNSAITLDASADFTTATTYMLSTMPWRTGFTDGITFDGSPSSNSSGKEPYVINGIEMAYGCYEIVSGVIINSDGSTGWIPFVAYDTQDDTNSLTANYTSCGASLPVDSSDSWKYPLYPEEHGAMVYGTTTGGSTTTGLADGHYTNKTATSGTREWRSLGNLSVARSAGPSCVSASDGLSSAGWHIGGRLSCNGRSRG